MSLNVQVIFLILFALITANLPFFSERRWLILSARGRKTFLQIAAEWIVFFALVCFLGYMLERQLFGFNHPQQWEFWVVVMCLYLVFAAPGYLYRYVWK